MKKVAMYLRLSKEDEYIRDESNSISSQRALIKKGYSAEIASAISAESL